MLAQLGCGGGDALPREPVSGTVTLAGEPLPSGSITFMPTDTNAAGTGATAPLTNGAYRVPRESGLVPGKYRVAISRLEEIATKSAAKAQPGDGDAPAMKERVPAKYNAQSTLNAEVSKGGKNVFDFSLDAK